MTDRILTGDENLLDVPGPWTPSRVVVGVDGTAANYTAVTWAAAEARRRGCPLVLLGVGSGDTPPSAPRTENLEREHIQRLAREMLESVRDRLVRTDLEVQIDVEAGEPSRALVHATDER